MTGFSARAEHPARAGSEVSFAGTFAGVRVVTDELQARSVDGEDDWQYDGQFLVAALLVYVAKGDGVISEKETEKMLSLVSEHFNLPSGASLELLTRATEECTGDSELATRLESLRPLLSEQEREDAAVMLLNVVAADGRKDASEMEYLRRAGEIMGISPEGMHRAFDRYFSETWI